MSRKCPDREIEPGPKLVMMNREDEELYVEIEEIDPKR